MARKGKRTASSGNGQVTDFRHEEATRKNKPPASIAPAYEVSERQTTRHGQAAFPCGEDVIAWFLDTDYDGKTFKIAQAFFPGDPGAWEKLQRALKAQIDPEAFEKMRGTVSFPFLPGEHKRIAVKVIDFRGNEVVRVMLLDGGAACEI
jgi:hypothetical protein